MNSWIAVERLALTLWLGGMVAIGYIVAPLLFKTLDDRMLAGRVAGDLFHIVGKTGLVCMALLIVIAVYQQGAEVWRSWPFYLLISVLVLLLASEYVVTPAMQGIKASAGGALEKGTEVYSQFARWHIVSSIIYLANTILGVVLVMVGVLPRT